jgi:hypothetical protein
MFSFLIDVALFNYAALRIYVFELVQMQLFLVYFFTFESQLIQLITKLHYFIP